MGRAPPVLLPQTPAPRSRCAWQTYERIGLRPRRTACSVAVADRTVRSGGAADRRARRQQVARRSATRPCPRAGCPGGRYFALVAAVWACAAFHWSSDTTRSDSSGAASTPDWDADADRLPPRPLARLTRPSTTTPLYSSRVSTSRTPDGISRCRRDRQPSRSHFAMRWARRSGAGTLSAFSCAATRDSPYAGGRHLEDADHGRGARSSRRHGYRLVDAGDRRTLV